MTIVYREKPVFYDMNKAFVKWYLKSLTKEQRELRIAFRGRRLIMKQYRWTHFNYHPWEDNKGE